jgi:hypothetical protein
LSSRTVAHAVWTGMLVTQDPQRKLSTHVCCDAQQLSSDELGVPVIGVLGPQSSTSPYVKGLVVVSAPPRQGEL